MSTRIFVLSIFLSSLLLSGCITTRTPLSSQRIKPRPLGSTLQTARLDKQKESRTGSNAKASAGVLILNEALALSLMNNPKLSAFSWEIRSRDAAGLQAGLFPNPKFSFEVENFVGTSDFAGVDQAETTLALSQRFETAGKRVKRKKLAMLQRDLASWDYETSRLDLFTQVSQRFVSVLGDQKKVALSQDLLQLAKQVSETVRKRVDAGKVSPVESIKADVALSSARIDLARSKRALHASRLKLAALWGSNAPQFKSVSGQLGLGTKLPPFKNLVERLVQNPELARWQDELSQRKARISLERAKAIPDMSLWGGFRQLNETDDSALVAALSFDLPIFNRNQGSIQEAQAQHSKGLAEQHATQLRLEATLAESYRALTTAHGEALMLQSHLLPGAEKAFDAVSEGYRLGKFDLLDVLDAQRTLSRAKTQYLNAQIEYKKALAAVERLIAEPVASGLMMEKTHGK